MKRKCFFCNGTGQMCNTCGEAEGVCSCLAEEMDLTECAECRGTGTASADLEK